MTSRSFDSFLELNRIAERTLAAGRTRPSLPVAVFRRGDLFVAELDLPMADREGDELITELGTGNPPAVAPMRFIP